jgi:fluoride exporter
LPLIAAFGILGVLARYGIDGWFAARWPGLPAGTFGINIAGSLLAGLVYSLGSGHLPENVRTALLIGFCGGFTTFSAYCVQTFSLFERGQGGLAVAYWLASPVLGLLGAYLGVLAGRALG